MRVLAIDDDVVMRDLLEALLPIEGHTIVAVDNGDAAIAALAAAPADFDVVLSDLHMPGTDTLALVDQLRMLRRPETVLVAMSASKPSAELLERFDAFLPKPFQPEDLAAAVQAARTRNEAVAPLPFGAGAAPAVAAVMLDESIFQKLAATLPAAQLLELYMMTLKDVAQRLERMRVAQADGDAVQLRREAHAIKGGCGMVGAAELRELAAAVEGGSLECTPPLEDFALACERLRRMLNERLASSAGQP